jgi:hypothetical protein
VSNESGFPVSTRLRQPCVSPKASVSRGAQAPREIDVHCSRELPVSRPYYRFALAIQGELDVLETGDPAADDPHAILATSREVTAEQAEAEVHWEQAGVLCGACRRELMAWLGDGGWHH